MPKQKDFDYKKAAADLEDVGAYEPDEIYRRKTKKSIDSYLRENDLNPKKYYKSNNKNSGSGSSGGCYLTSACVEAKGLPDDCQELQTLRAFRDTYLAHQTGGQEEIAEYYRIAPAIVETINLLPNADEVWNTVYAELVQPCVERIHAGELEAAHRRYKAYSLQLAALAACSKTN